MLPFGLPAVFCRVASQVSIVSGSQPALALVPSPVSASGAGKRPASMWSLAVCGEIPRRAAAPAKDKYLIVIKRPLHCVDA